MASEQEQKQKALKLTLERLDKTYGKGIVMKLGDEPVEQIEAIPSGSLTLDLALGVQGYPKGRIIEIYGPESSGKTTLAIHAIAECQKQGGICAFVDAEHAFDKYYAESLGVDTENLLISQPDNGEQALEIADNLIRSGAIDLLIVDSVAALTPRAEIEGEMGDAAVGLQARLMSKALRKLTGTISKTGEIIDLGVEVGIIKKSGSWFSYGDTKLGQGREAVRSLLNDNPELFEELENAIVASLGEKKTKSETVEA